MDSILTSVKKMLGIEAEDTSFDSEITLHINSVIMVLGQIGIGPESGFSIESAEETWSDLIGDRTDLAAVRTYVYLKVRMVFDPPSSAFVLEAMERQVTQLEWRLNNQAEGGE